MYIPLDVPNAVEQTDIAYQEVKDVVTIGRGVGLWGDMVRGDVQPSWRQIGGGQKL